MRAAANGGYIELLKWVLSSGCKLDKTIFEGAIRHGKIEIVIWLNKQHSKMCNTEPRLNNAAIKSGNLELVKLLRKWNYPWSDTVVREACILGKYDIVQWLYDNNAKFPSDTCELIASSGNLGLLKWITLKGFALENSLLSAAKFGRLDIVIWIVKILEITPDKNLLVNTALGGNLNVMMWLINNGCICDHTVLNAAVECGNIANIEWIIQHISIIYLTPPNILKKSNKTNLNPSVIFTTEHATMTAKKGNLVLLKWLKDHGCDWDEDIAGAAVTEADAEALYNLVTGTLSELKADTNLTQLIARVSV